MKHFFPYDVFGRLASLKVNVIILLLKCSYCLPHSIFKKKPESQKARKERQQQKKSSRQRYPALDTLSERCTMTMHHQISAHRSLMPAGDGSRCSVRYLVPDKAKSVPRPYETDPFRWHLSSISLT